MSPDAIPEDVSPLLAAAAAIADGGRVDWDTLASSESVRSDPAMIEHLRVIAEIVALQQRQASAAALTSVADELREEEPRAPDPRDGLPSWGPLRLLEIVGRGAYGEVYRAWDSRLDREVALKLLRRRPSRREAGSTFVGEGRLLARIHHPNVVTVHGADRIGDHVGIWMEYVDGTTLGRRVAESGPFPFDEVLRIGRDLCKALSAVHRAGLLHRDVKAQNVMRGSDGRIVLMDFGAGREQRIDGEHGSGVAGTPLYLAPELFEGGSATRQSDLYSLGVLLHYLATGAYPVDGRSVAEIRRQHQQEAHRSVLEVRPDLPASFAAVVDRATSRDPAARWETADAMGAALAAIAEPAVHARRPRSVAAWVAVAAAIAAIGVAAAERLRSPSTAGGMVIRRVAANAPIDGITGLSSDGRHASRADPESGNLTLVDLATGQRRPLTTAPDSDEAAEFSAFSPDDRHIAYVWLTSAGTYELRVVGADGAPPRLLYRSDETRYIPLVEWAPDGKRLLLVLQKTDGTNQLALLPAAGGTPRLLQDLGRRAPSRMSFSPDGRFVAYDIPPQPGARERDIFALAVDGSGGGPLVQHPANDFVLGWTPDGRRLLFGSDRSGTIGAWSLAVADGRAAGDPELVRPDLGSGWPIRLTRSGAYYYGVPIATNDVHVATLDATLSEVISPPVQIAQQLVGTNRWPDWSPDGARLAYVSQFRPGSSDSAPWALTIDALDGSKPRRLNPPLSQFLRLRWAPDGASILAHGRDEHGRGGLFRIDLQTGQATMTVPSAAMPRDAAWTRDGQSILYWDMNLGPNAPIIRRNLKTGAERPIGPGGAFALSPDNRWLVVSREDPQKKTAFVELEAIDTGVSRRLLDSAGPGNFTGGCSWSPDSRLVLCIKNAPGRANELWRASIDGGKPSRVLVQDGMSDARINPDGRRIAFSVAKGTTELWVMENFVGRGK